VNAGANNTGWWRQLQGGQEMLFAEGRGYNSRSGLLGAVARTLGRLCRNFRWLADAVARRRFGESSLNGAENAMSLSQARSTSPRKAGEAVLAIGFGSASGGSGIARRFSVCSNRWSPRWNVYCAGWRQYQAELLPLDEPRYVEGLNRYRGQHGRCWPRIGMGTSGSHYRQSFDSWVFRQRR